MARRIMHSFEGMCGGKTLYLILIFQDPPAFPYMAATRRLSAILAADVAAYSRLLGADEEGTLARLNSHHRELIAPKIREHRGRIVKTTGDGALVEFASVVGAVRCAVEVQRGMTEREPGYLKSSAFAPIAY
jgi:class 3 adenylate cyclase